MKLTVIGSRSDGNSYALYNAQEALLLEAGLPFKKVLDAIDYRLNTVAGCLVSHEHDDHAKCINEYLRNRVPVYASQGTVHGLMERFVKPDAGEPQAVPYTADGAFMPFTLGGFTVLPFHTIHSTNEPTGFYIYHEEIGSMLFATDTCYLPQRFASLSNIMIEANYDRATLDNRYWNGDVTQRRYKHTLHGHMCIDTTIEALQANDLSRVNNIILIHLSEENAEPESFRQRVERATGKRVYVAQPGLTIEFNKTPF
jgi:phosphoribosyl 1,2-cyclic phosphodiesterase